MARNLPSLNAVRMFEAAARHKNFTRAADQLCVTQGAVSRQIKILEEDLNQSLFRRNGPKVELTEVGERLYRGTVAALAILRREFTEIRRLSETPTLTISMLPSFASKWLVPRITLFQNEFSQIDLRISASYEVVDFDTRPDIDIAIRLGESVSHPDLYCERLFGEKVFPVCSPEFKRKEGLNGKPQEIAKKRLLYTTRCLDHWQEWFKAAGIEPPSDDRGSRYSDQLLLQQAAAEGLGVALGRSVVADDDIRAGRLVRLSDIEVDSRSSYYFVCPKGRETQTRVQNFLTWLRRESTDQEISVASAQ